MRNLLGTLLLAAVLLALGVSEAQGESALTYNQARQELRDEDAYPVHCARRAAQWFSCAVTIWLISEETVTEFQTNDAGESVQVSETTTTEEHPVRTNAQIWPHHVRIKEWWAEL